MQIFLNCHLATFAWPLEALKKYQITILKDLHVHLLLYQSLYDLTNIIGRNLISVLVLTHALARNLISALGLTNLLGRRLISALVLTSQVPHDTHDSALLDHAFLTAPGCLYYT